MKIKISTVEHEGSCNYCDKGSLSSSGRGLIFPYQEVTCSKGKWLVLYSAESVSINCKKLKLQSKTDFKHRYSNNKEKNNT